MKKKIFYRLTELNTFDICVLEKLIDQGKVRFTRHDIGNYLNSIDFEQVTQQYFSERMKKLIDLELVIMEGKKPKTYVVNPKYYEYLIVFVKIFKKLENELCKK